MQKMQSDPGSGVWGAGEGERRDGELAHEQAGGGSGTCTGADCARGGKASAGPDGLTFALRRVAWDDSVAHGDGLHAFADIGDDGCCLVAKDRRKEPLRVRATECVDVRVAKSVADDLAANLCAHRRWRGARIVAVAAAAGRQMARGARGAEQRWPRRAPPALGGATTTSTSRRSLTPKATIALQTMSFPGAAVSEGRRCRFAGDDMRLSRRASGVLGRNPLAQS